MILTPLFILSLGATCLSTGPLPSPDPATGVNRETLYKQGIRFDQFLHQAVERREMWLQNYERATVPDRILKRARAVPGQWYLLVVAEDWCSDSANTIPYLARLVGAVGRLEMRIIDSDVGRTVMDDHRTPDGRAATPTVVLLDANFDEVGCFIERPRELQEWALEHREELDDEEFLRSKFAWYDRDSGVQTMSEVVELLEAGASGSKGC